MEVTGEAYKGDLWGFNIDPYFGQWSENTGDGVIKNHLMATIGIRFWKWNLFGEIRWK